MGEWCWSSHKHPLSIPHLISRSWSRVFCVICIHDAFAYIIINMMRAIYCSRTIIPMTQISLGMFAVFCCELSRRFYDALISNDTTLAELTHKGLRSWLANIRLSNDFWRELNGMDKETPSSFLSSFAGQYFCNWGFIQNSVWGWFCNFFTSNAMHVRTSLFM